jgi:glycosyltransferase involved in cell wall biosynthesis
MLKLTVVIPTIGTREPWLLRAVQSAIYGWEPHECEVLIVLNANLDKYELIVEHFKTYPNIFVITNKTGGVSAARNLGLKLAKGIAIRFVDDDDYLYPKCAVQQTNELLMSDADLSSFGIDLVDENSKLIASRHPLALDCIRGLCSTQRVQIPVSLVYKTKAIKNNLWNENLSIAEDTLWLLTILEQNINLKWISKSVSVGVWFQHSKTRLSRSYSTNQSASLIAIKLIEIANKLPDDELKSARISCITDSMWACFLAGFKFSPLKWSATYRIINKLNSSSGPQSKIYQHIPINPLVLSWILLPAFWIYHAIKLSLPIKITKFNRK